MNAPIARRNTDASELSAGCPPVRLALRPPTFPPGPVCGAWWPRTDELATELAALTDVFDATHGRVTRIASPRGSWATEPRTLAVRGHLVSAAWYTSGLDPCTIRLFSYGAGRWDLLVVPSDTRDDTAARLMHAAADPALRLTGTALMAAEGPSGPRRDDDR
ncbi:DUF5994 family protein [Streptomyces sp. BH097]|uniref:DUF5994 family protein n=1 Tax=unclassified Streptomyces TaxID=2593676 RepID=UPI003BB7E323